MVGEMLFGAGVGLNVCLLCMIRNIIIEVCAKEKNVKTENWTVITKMNNGIITMETMEE